MQNPLRWTVRCGPASTLVEFEVVEGDGIVAHTDLARIALPDELASRETTGVILSGRGPVWLYAWLTHRLHAFAWLAINDPRLGGAVVISRHRPDAPAIGSLVPLP